MNNTTNQKFKKDLTLALIPLKNQYELYRIRIWRVLDVIYLGHI